MSNSPMSHILGAAPTPAPASAAQASRPPASAQPPRAPAPAPAPVQPEEVGEEYDRAPTTLEILLSHHLGYYDFPEGDKNLIGQAVHMLRTDRRCKNKNNWAVFNPDGRDFLTVTNDKELSRAAGARGTAVRLSFIEMLDQHPVPLGQVLVFRDEFRPYLTPCSHLIALQLMSRPLVEAITARPISRDTLLSVKSAVAEVYDRRHRRLTAERLYSVSLAVVAEAYPKGMDWEQIEPVLEKMVLKIAPQDFQA